MGYLLKEVLKTLCGVNQWSYAVFWKIGCQNPKLLIWEECYYGPASFSTLPGISGICNREFAFQDYGNNASSVTAETRNLWPDISAGDNVHFLVNKMTMDNYVEIVGEGLVGRAAFTGNHQWILSDYDYREAHPPEIVKELGQQFSAGMQTVAVIPVLPHGVVQFGSSLTIPENNGFVNDVVSLVHPLGYIAKDPDPICPVYSTPGDLSSSFVSDSFNYVGCSSSTMGGIRFSEQKTESDNGSQLHFTSKNLSEMGTSLSDSFDHLTTNSLFAYCSGVEDNRVNDMPAKTEFEQAKIAQAMPGFVEAGINQKIEGQINLVNNTNHHDAWFQPQSGEDLFDILGDEFDNKLFSNWSNSRLSNVSPKNNSPSRKNLVSSSEIISSTQEKSDSGIFSFNNTDDHLLDAVVSKVPYGRFGVSDHVKGELLGIPQYMANAGALKNRPSKEESRTFSQGSSIYDSWVETGRNTKQNNSSATACSSKSHDETNKTKRKRLKPGENPRPRPKDRQMIQDRVKELREIVPNGAKCSIDALLERTIKHMLFLQSVTKHADKLKQTVESKIISKDGGMLMKDNNGGATWAYEVGSQSMVCPIIVEDLNQPRQMLVEMLCEERGIFLEIADIIRGLGLTILKGLMETRNDKIWAHFTVEANRNITRMEVFISLVHLLEQNAKNGVQQPNNVSNVNTMVGLC